MTIGVPLFTKDILAGTGKLGLLKPDENGYYPITLGAFDAFTEANVYYPFNDYLQALFHANSALARRINRRAVFAEVDHPELVPGMSGPMYLNRLREIRLSNACAHIAKVTATEAKDHEGRRIIRVDGLVSPYGAKAHVLDRALENKEQDACFSIRSIVVQKKSNDRIENQVVELVTWDMVSEPGLRIARKYMSPGLESLFNQDDSFILNEDMVSAAEKEVRVAGLESSHDLASTTMLRTEMGWQKVQLVSPSSTW